MYKRQRRLLTKFARNERGAVGLIFGLAFLPLIGLTGAAVDYTRASQVRAKMSVAADAAVLAAVKASGKTLAERRVIADAVFAGNLGQDASLSNVSGVLTVLPGNVYRYEATGRYAHLIMQVVPGVGDNTRLGVEAEANAGDGSVEVSLVLDNTGSMTNDMAALREASKQFTNILFDNSGGVDLKMSVVPYVAAVNPGRSNLSMMHIDTRGDSPWQAKNMRGRYIAEIDACMNDPNWQPGPGGGGNKDPGKGGSGAWLQDGLRKLGDLGIELFGVKQAAAQVGAYGTPNRTAPFSGREVTINKPYAQQDGTKAFVPTGFMYDGIKQRCMLMNPSKIAHLDLFDGIKTPSGKARWKGCVEARPAPFDVTDDPPIPGDARTLFSPYFWQDESGAGGKGDALGYINNYMNDGTVPAGWSMKGPWQWQFNLFKYNGKDQDVSFSENPPNTSGPNKACPDELLRLTNSRKLVLNKIDSLNHWNGGGTISSEGIMWGWRTLSPKLPFADAKAYGTPNHKKVMVVMTDGENELGESVLDGPALSHYSSYGYLRLGRFPQPNFQVAHDYLNERMTLACDNAKAAGIQIITILFRENSSKSKQLVKNCASSGQLFFMAKDRNELQKVFTEVASAIGRIRITR